MKQVLVDTGPLVAIFSPEDNEHDTCVNALHDLPGPLLSCWPVVTEAAWLLRPSPRAVLRLLASIDGSFLELLPLSGVAAQTISKLMTKYEDIRPQLADAALVHLADREQIDSIFTLDRRDFSIYRNSRGRSFKIIPEAE